MKLDHSMWSVLHIYLIIERKLSDSQSSISALKSRFFVLCKYFSDKPFNRVGFVAFLGEMKRLEYATSYLNGFITMGKYVDDFLKLNELKDFTYFPDARRVNVDVLTPHEIEKLATVHIPYAKMCDTINQRQEALLLLLGTTGCRIGEALTLQWRDVYTAPASLIFEDTKNNTNRHIPISTALLLKLQKLPQTSPYIFTSGRGGKLETPQVNLDLKKRAKAVGITKPVWCHIFRHSYVTTMLESGCEISDVGYLVGHLDPKSTMRYKNSLISHYSGVIMLHPLLKKGLTLDMISKKMKEYISKLVDTESYSLEIQEDSETFKVSIRKGGK